MHKGDKKAYRETKASIVRYIFERDGGMCVYCGNYAQEIDHIIPTKDGGMSIRSNLVCICRSCNTKKAHHLDDVIWFTKAIFWLLKKGEDVSWMDTFYDK